MIEISDCHSPSIVLYYNNKNENNTEEKMGTCRFGHQYSFPHNDDFTRSDLLLYCIGEDKLNESTFRLH